MIEYLPIVLTGIGLTASILYYSIILRNANKTQKMQLETRQVQMFMMIGNVRNSIEFQRLFYRVAYIDEWSDIEDYYRKYNPEKNLDGYSEHLYIWQLFDTIGFLLEKSVIDLSFLDDLLKTSIMDVWIKYEPVIYALRERSSKPKLWKQFEYLANELMKTT
ncbi:MAG: hypothetical protein NWF07_03535 [Candidatus Bathyarchaeota archaeon]|nr:hypothetical protein [Candidatus Bathyarchaeota archaeon]